MDLGSFGFRCVGALLGGLGRGFAQRSVSVERIRFQLETNLEERPFGDRSVLRPHVDGVATGVTKGGGQFDGRTEERDCLSSSDHASMLNLFSVSVQAHLAASSLKFFT